MDFKNIDKKYRAVPFWSWNDRLTADETKRQVGVMDEAGIGGFMMHARGGLLTEYMGDEWFDNINAAIEEARARGMHPWAYDENGWPSGFAGGKVTDLGFKYHQKILKVRKFENEKHENSLLIKDGNEYYFDVNPYYIDVIDRDVIAEFIKSTHEQYYERCGKTFEGFFTDEPQMANCGKGFPWSLILPERFYEAYGYSLVENLDALFSEKENSKRIRRDFWYLITCLFSEGYFKQIGDWCTEHGYGFTGHLMTEDDMFNQMFSSGAAMPHYEYFTHPGIDWLGRHTNECLTAKQLGSAAAQTGKKHVLSETFALCGHNVSFAELKGIFEYQMVRGINLLCPHLEGYSNKGKRKRDYPPALYFQQPWWDYSRTFFDSMARVGMILSEGREIADALLIHTQTSVWELYDGDKHDAAAEKIWKINGRLLAEMRELEHKHVLYHLGDEIMMQRHGRTEGGKLVIGEMAYSTVIVPADAALLDSTKELLAEFAASGGRIVRSASEISANPICAENGLTYTMRAYPDFDVHYFVNTQDAEVCADISVGNLTVNIETGDTEPFCGKVRLGKYESAMIVDTHEPRIAEKEKKPTPVLNLCGEWSVKSASYNSLTLDRCDYAVDGGEWNKDTYVLDILPRLNVLRRAAVLEQKYSFFCEELSDEMFLATETPEIFEISVNGVRLDKNDVGYFRDTSFRMIPIRKLLKRGENEIYFKSTVSQSDACYKHIDNSWTCETMRNCLAFDVEIEQIYIVGDFGVDIKDTPEELERGAYRIKNQPVITAAPRTVYAEHLDASGYPTFAGELTLERTFNISDVHTRVKLKGHGMNVLSLSVNGKHVGERIWAPYDVDLSEYLHEGENRFELTVVNNLRNMQGPFHLKIGESYSVCPPDFYREHNIITALIKDESCHDVLDHWDDGICLVHFGLDGE